VSETKRFQLNRWQSIFLASFFTALIVFLLKYIGDLTNKSLLFAPFAASLMLIFAVTHSPFVRTKNLVFGYAIGGLVGLFFFHSFGANIWTLSLSAGLSLLVMEVTHTLHPPAVAVPIAIISEHSAWSFLWMPLAGGVAIMVLASYFHRKFIRRFPIHMS
jgi:CBS-domain-containing membrane protein